MTDEKMRDKDWLLGIKNMNSKAVSKFKVGQVVRVNTDYYNITHKSEQYQRITRVWPWSECEDNPFGYSLVNGDQANQKWLIALTKKEIG
jgi:hypothetical protein